MSPFLLLITLPMVGIRGFYNTLFPCYNIEFGGDLCGEYLDGFSQVNFFPMFCLMVSNQFIRQFHSFLWGYFCSFCHIREIARMRKAETFKINKLVFISYRIGKSIPNKNTKVVEQ
jgi:hypothetical protein